MEFLQLLLKYFKRLIVIIVEFGFECGYFLFKNKFYKQLDGTLMGSHASPILANIVMEHILEQTEEKLQFKLAFM